MAWLNKPVRFFFLDGDEMVGVLHSIEHDIYRIEDEAGKEHHIPVYGIKRYCEAD